MSHGGNNMALTKVFKPTKFASMFDVYKPEYDALDEAGLTVEVTSKSFSLLGPNGEKIVSNVGLAQGVVGLAAAGDLPSIAKGPVKAIIESSFKHATKAGAWQHQVTVDDIVDEDDDKPAFVDIEGEIKTAAAKGLANKLDESLMSQMLDLDEDDLEEADSAPETVQLKVHDKKVWDVPGDVGTETGSDGSKKVKLEHATKMYQPVASTSETSTYFCVGIAGPFKFAARRNEQSLSIRVEGPVGAEKSALVAAGFNESYIGKGYTSVHFHGIDDVMAQRALGAVLMGTGFEFSTPIPNLAKLVALGGS